MRLRRRACRRGPFRHPSDLRAPPRDSARGGGYEDTNPGEFVVPVTLNWVTRIRLKYLSANRLQALREDTPFPQQRTLTDIGHASHSGVSSRAWAPWLWAVGPLKPFLTLPKTGILNWGRGAESRRFGAKMQGSIQ